MREYGPEDVGTLFSMQSLLQFIRAVGARVDVNDTTQAFDVEAR